MTWLSKFATWAKDESAKIVQTEIDAGKAVIKAFSGATVPTTNAPLTVNETPVSNSLTDGLPTFEGVSVSWWVLGVILIVSLLSNNK